MPPLRPRPLRSVRWLLLVMTLIAAREESVQAADQGEAGRAMEEGSQALSRGEFEAAVSHFRRAHRLEPTATGPLLGLGLALRAIGQCPEAIIHLEDYLRRKPDGNPNARKALEQCRAAGSRPPVAPHPGAPADLRSGSAPIERQALGQTGAGAVAPGGGSTGKAGAVVVGQGAAATPEETPPIYRRWWFWTAIGVVIVGGAVAGGVFGARSGAVSAPGGTLGPAQAAFK